MTKTENREAGRKPRRLEELNLMDDFLFQEMVSREGNPSQELRDMLKYMEQTTDENVTNQSIADIHKLVQKVKWDRKVGINYMKSWERENIARDEGRIEGRIETLLDILGEMGEIRADLASKIEQEENPKVLTGWIKLAGRVSSLAEFERQMQQNSQG